MSSFLDIFLKSPTVRKWCENKYLQLIVVVLVVWFIFTMVYPSPQSKKSLLPSDLQALNQSLKTASAKTDPFLRERFIQQEAKRLGLTSDDYRKLLAIRKDDSAELPDAPSNHFSLISWFYLDLSSAQRLQLMVSGVVWLIKLLPSLTIVFAGVRFLLEIPQRDKDAKAQAWQVVRAAKGEKVDSARIAALEDLREKGESLAGLVLEGGTDLSGINLKSADLREAILNEAIFRLAHLEGANFNGAELKGTKFNGAYLMQTNFTDVKDLTPEQVTVAHNWELAIYDVDLLKKLVDKSENKIYYALADFRSQTPETQNLQLDKYKTEWYHCAYSQGLKLLISGKSYVEVQFNLDDKPTQGYLVLSHVTSSNFDILFGGFAPVNITINGNFPTKVNSQDLDQNQRAYNPAEYHDFTDGYSTDVFPITEFLQKGANSIRVQLDEKALTQYWIQTLLIRYWKL